MSKSTIRLDDKVKANTSKKKKLRRPNKPGLILLLIASITVFVLAGAAIYLVVIPAQKITGSVNTIMSSLSSIQQDMEGKDLTRLDGYINNISTELAAISSEVDKYQFLQELELTKGYYLNLQIVQDISRDVGILLSTSLPELKVILKSVGYAVEEGDPVDIMEAGDVAIDNSNTEDQINGIIKELPRVIQLYDEIESQVIDIIKQFNQLDPNYIPAIGSGSLKQKVTNAQQVTSEFPAISAQLKQTLGVLPQLLGSEGPTSYLVVYQNEKEMRASGGLLSAYGNLTIDKGELGDNISAVDMWDLEGYVSWTLGIDAGYRNIYGQNALMNSGCGGTYLRAQDSGIYPDLYLTMDMFKDYYDIANRYNPTRYPNYNHIVILNTFFASDIISLVEPLDVPGSPEPITAANAAKIIFGETASQPLDPAIRKQFIGDVATALKDKFNELSANDFPRIIQLLIRTIQAKNIAFYSKDDKVQAYFDELGLSGRIEHNFAGDYFHLNEAQNCSLKANFYVRDSIIQDIVIGDGGSINKYVHINWINEKVYDKNEENIISASPNFRYRAWVRIFAPPGTKFTGSDGYEKSQWFYWPQTYFDNKVEKEISDNVIWFDHRRFSEAEPPKTHSLNVNYSLPDSIKYSDELGYRMLLQKHPGKADEKYTINITYEGSITTAEFTLDRDKVLTFRGGVISVANYDTRLDQYYDIMENLKSTD